MANHTLTLNNTAKLYFNPEAPYSHAFKREDDEIVKKEEEKVPKEFLLQDRTFLSFRKPAPVTIPEKVRCHAIRAHY